MQGDFSLNSWHFKILANFKMKFWYGDNMLAWNLPNIYFATSTELTYIFFGIYIYMCVGKCSRIWNIFKFLLLLSNLKAKISCASFSQDSLKIVLNYNCIRSSDISIDFSQLKYQFNILLKCRIKVKLIQKLFTCFFPIYIWLSLSKLFTQVHRLPVFFSKLIDWHRSDSLLKLVRSMQKRKLYFMLLHFWTSWKEKDKTSIITEIHIRKLTFEMDKEMMGLP